MTDKIAILPKNTNLIRRKIRFLLLSAASTTLISLGASPSATRAADVTWTVGGNSEYWSTPANWSTQQVPGPSDNVTIAWSVDGSLHDPVLLDVDATINMLTMGSTGQHITAKLDIKQSNSLTVLNDIDMFGDVAPFISMSGKSSLTVNGDIRLNATGDGSIQIRGGTFKHAVDKTIHLGGESGTNSGFGFHSAGTTVTTGTVYAGDKGRGQITLTTGASMTSAALHVASGATSTGLVDMQSSDTIFHVTGEVGVGEAGKGVLSVYDNAKFKADTDIKVATEAGSEGTINIGNPTDDITTAGEDDITAAGVIDAAAIAFGAGTGTINFRHNTANYEFNPVMSGNGILNNIAGTTILKGMNTEFTGSSNVIGGTLLVDGAIGGTVHVSSDASLGGKGTIGGNTTVDDGGILLGSGSGKLTFNQDLTLSSTSKINVSYSGSSHAELFDVKGALTLGGVINVDSFGDGHPGVYHVFHYDTLSGSATVGTLPTGVNPTDVTIHTDTAGKYVNLLNSGGLTVEYWNGSTTTPDQQVHGGSGTWDLSITNWVDENGANSVPWGNDRMAMFQGASGTVTIDTSGGAIQAGGLVFLTDGYVVTGGNLTLDKASARVPVIQVGYGSDTSKSWTTTMDSVLVGSDGLSKTGKGTLILTKDAQYSGTTTVAAGTLQLGDGHTEGFIDSDVVLAGNQPEDSILVFNRSDEKLFDKSISGAGSVIQRGPGTTTFAGNNSYSGGLTVENGVAKAGVADVAFGLGRVAIKSGATLDLADFDTTIGGLAGEESGDGNITLGSGALTLNQDFDSQFSGIISGTGDLIKNDSGKLTLYGANTYSGTTSVTGGQLVQGAAHAFSAASAYSVANNALLDLGGFSTAVASLSNSGTVHFGGAGGTVLSVSGDYTGGGTLVFNTVLGDDSSKTDQLKVDGDTSGTTTVMVVNRDGLGAQTKEGIKIIDVAGQSNGIFDLASDFKTKDGQQAVVAGAYAYTLHKNGVADPADGDWYLRSQLENPHPHPNPPHPNPPHPHPEPTPHFNPATPVYEGYSQTLQALNKLPSLQQRVGNRYWDGAANPVIEQGADSLGTPLVPADATIDARGIWGRIEGAHNRFQLNRSTTGRKQEINTLIIQAGVDGQFYEDESGRLIGGITGQYGKARSDISSAHGDGQIDTQGWGLGGTLTWYGNDGFYVDTQAQAMWYYSDLDSHTANKSLIDDNKALVTV